ncbi:hypothetical protein [Streptomyces marianii]|uniref:hypothetical protein n=1 Tax=Streptomyces marianii TaxID=1817406 RepID=UPI00389A232A
MLGLLRPSGVGFAASREPLLRGALRTALKNGTLARGDVPGIGPVCSEQHLGELGISPSRRVQALGARQRAALLSRFSSRPAPDPLPAGGPVPGWFCTRMRRDPGTLGEWGCQCWERPACCARRRRSRAAARV